MRASARYTSLKSCTHDADLAGDEQISSDVNEALFLEAE